MLQQTVAEAALDEEARRLGLGQSTEETLKTIFNDPNFKGVNGSFDPQRFQGLIRQMGYSEQRFIAAGVTLSSAVVLMLLTVKFYWFDFELRALHFIGIFILPLIVSVLTNDWRKDK